jgi:hypothetical protein
MDSFRGHPGAMTSPDGSASEAGGDSGLAAIDAGDGGKPPFTLHCNELSPIPKFCDDFERTSLLGNSWDLDSTSPGGSTTLDTNDSRSPIRSLLCKTPSDTGSLEALLQRSFPDVSANIVLRFDMKIDAALQSGNVIPVLLGLGSPSASANNEMSLHPTGTSWLEADYRVSPARFQDHAFTREPAFGSWERVKVELQPSHIKVSLDDDVVVDDPLTYPVSPSRFYLQMGLDTQEVKEASTLHIDNVALDWQ